MAISLSPETQKLIEERMRQADFPSADELVRVALDALDRMENVEESGDLDAETWAAIDRAEAEYEQGGGIPLDDAFAQFRVRRDGAPLLLPAQ